MISEKSSVKDGWENVDFLSRPPGTFFNVYRSSRWTQYKEFNPRLTFLLRLGFVCAKSFVENRPKQL